MAYFLNFFSLSWDNNKWHDNHAENIALKKIIKDLYNSEKKILLLN
jgi:hypothetical protein